LSNGGWLIIPITNIRFASKEASSFPYYCKIHVYEPRYNMGSEVCELFSTQFCSSKHKNI
ncbi:MAG TPA: hypothetical protein VIY98_13705, partial [Nitrososphaeraceae archaeon]